MPLLVLDDGSVMEITPETATLFSLPCPCGRRVVFRVLVEPLTQPGDSDSSRAEEKP